MNKLEKAVKKLPEDMVDEIDRMSQPELEALIAKSEENMEKAREERDANEKYQAAKQAVKDLSDGLREVNTFQKAKITVALHRIRDLKA